jgi:hypothetical protein
MRRWFPHPVAGLLLLLFVAGCDLLDEDKPANLVLGEHLAGLRPGDDSLLVVNTLGTPQRKTTDARGNRHWRYTEGEAAGLTVVLADSGVVRVRAEVPYALMSEEGIGLGSTAGEVERVWGLPTRRNELDTLRYEMYVYAAAGRYVGVEYRSDRVVAVEVEAWEATPGIVWGESIEGVRIGDDSTRVVQLLGPPSWVSSETPDSRFFVYQRDVFNTRWIELYIGFGVFSYQIFEKSMLQTSEGVGVGTSRGELIRKFGKPANSDYIEVISDNFHFNRVFFNVEYREINGDALVFRIRMQQLDD